MLTRTFYALFCLTALLESILCLVFLFLHQQEEKIAALQTFADQLIQGRHYAAAEIAERRADVLGRSDTYTISSTVLLEYFAALNGAQNNWLAIYQK